MTKRTALLAALQSLFPERSKKELYALVLCGEVCVDGEVVRDPKRVVRPEASIRVKEANYVSRGGAKLEAALAAFDFSVSGRVVLDAGASTGGFTDCLLRHGASFVHAVDSGHNQLAYALRVDPRVSVLEDTPVQTVERLEPRPEVAVADISFRSITEVAPHILALTSDREGVLLLKPQFEWRKPPDRFDGVVRREEDLLAIVTDAIAGLGYRGVVLRAAVESPLRGRLGNREFLVHACAPRPAIGADSHDVSGRQPSESPASNPSLSSAQRELEPRDAPSSVARLLVTEGRWTGSD